MGGRDVWRVRAYTDVLAAGREELRNVLAEIIKTARKSVGEEKAKRWLEKLGRGCVLMEGWPKYEARLANGALVVRFTSPRPDSIEGEAQRFRDMGLKEGVHFSVKMPEEGRYGYVSILKEGLARAAWLSVYGTEGQRDLAAEFIEYILQRAEEGGDAVYEKAKEIIEEGKERDSLRLEDFETEVEVDGRRHKVKVIGGDAEVEEGRGGRKLLRIRITAEVGRVEGEHTIVNRVMREYTITFSRRGRDNAAVAYAYAEVDDAERLAAVIKALTGKELRIHRMKDGKIKIVCYREHLEGFMRFAELAEAIAKWLKETSR